ncbi:MAG: MoaD/ThiS family protein [Candidatus Promineofilum sp.]|nr:MoaD/ThiS family protein [Promineifilum sp.]MCW5861895.1 MoaD/ThiS family protein [Anaerolineae bacterium]
MKVNFFATLRQVTGQKTVDLDLPDGVTVQQVLDAVVNRYPAMTGMLADDAGKLLGHCHIFINGRGVNYMLDQMDSVVRHGDTVNFFPAVGGGAGGGALPVA